MPLCLFQTMMRYNVVSHQETEGNWYLWYLWYIHADSPLSAKLRGKFKLCEETRGGHYFGHSQNSAEFRGVD